MLKLAAVAALIGICSGLPRLQVAPLDVRIVGGSDADIADFPYQLSLQYNDQHFCGAVNIAPTWAVTAAHCVVGGVLSGFSVRAGSSTKSSGGQKIPVSRIIPHPQYNDSQHDYDIALLELSEAITVRNASPATLPEADSPIPNGAIAIVTGWGMLKFGGRAPEILQVVQVPVVSQTECKRAYDGVSSVTDRMFCAGLLGVGGKDACQQDSGGPVIVEGVLTGLVSWGAGCAAAFYPGVYTNVRAFRTWIGVETGL